MEESENTEGKSSVEEQASPITASKAQNLPEGFCEDVNCNIYINLHFVFIG